jgi:hypothetical protein
MFRKKEGAHKTGKKKKEFDVRVDNLEESIMLICSPELPLRGFSQSYRM